MYAILDSGSDISLVNEQIIQDLRLKLTPANIVVHGISTTPTFIKNQINLSIHFLSRQYKVDLFVTTTDLFFILLGRDFLRQHKVSLDFGRDLLILQDGQTLPFISPHERETNKLLQSLPLLCPEKENKIITLRVEEHTTLHPNKSSTIQLNTDILNDGNYLFVEKATLITELGVMLEELAYEEGIISIKINNLNDNNVQLYKNTKLASLLPIPNGVIQEPLEIETAQQEMELENHKGLSLEQIKIKESQHFITGILKREDINTILEEDLPPEFKDQFTDLLMEFSDIFYSDGEILPTSKITIEPIQLKPGATPIKQTPYRTSEYERIEIQKHLDELIKHGIVEPSNSAWASPVIIVKNGHRGGGTSSSRFCVDLRKVNQHIVDDSFPIQSQELLFNNLRKSKYFTGLDLAKGYLQCKLCPEDQLICSFVLETGVFCFTRLPFGLKVAPAKFVKTLTTIFRPYLGDFLENFVDDFIIHSQSHELHLEHLRKIFELLREYKLSVSTKKSKIAATKIKILGNFVSAAGIEPDPSKIEAIIKLEPPDTIRKLRIFLGLANYHKKYLKNLSVICKPLYALIENNSVLQWNEDHQQAWDTVKKLLTTVPVLQHFRDHLPIIIYTDSSEFGAGSCLSQPDKENNTEYVVEYFSKVFS